MNLKINLKSILIVILLVTIGFGYYQKKVTDNNYRLNLLAVSDTIVKYKTAYYEEVESKRSIIAENKRHIMLSDSLKSIVKTFKKPENIIKYKYIVKTDTVEVPMYVGVAGDEFKFKHDDGFNLRSGTVSGMVVKLDPLLIRNEITMVSGWKRGKLFKRGHYAIDVHNTNPYIQSQNINHFVVIPKRAWHEKWYVTIPVGIGIGFAAANL